MLIASIILFSIIYLFQINRLTHTLCERKEIPEEKQPKIYRTINVLITILLLNFYLEVVTAM
ncbi:hypothetical protein GCM10007425_17120 [Lysinibacillus alkalisoli]|uniref:Uncharacterized protein n=1 Tax=Lysinibacillus alkalisoli TaxID=1911548 RepID=A0A917G5D5_9BACI|nr:hypothetical protein [Lysinibacillus alkalisoli]GGG23171.1 hypothetical protein GCM10007425_17120 [Lysinibacillus alkalisoli]